MSRSRAIAVTLVAGMILLLAPLAVAEEPSIPLDLQAQLSAKITEYVENPSLAGSGQLTIGVLVNARDADSMRAGVELRAAFARVGGSGRRGFDAQVIQWAGASALVDEIARRKLGIIYLTPGLSSELATIVTGLAHQRVLTIAAVDTYVAGGAILGYELSSGHPRMILNLRQAKRQEVVLRAALMKLARIIE